MKSLLVLAAVLVSGNAFAVSASDSWATIRSSNAVAISQPQFAGQFGAEGLFNACDAGESYKSINPVKYCAKGEVVYSGQGETSTTEYVCSEWAVSQVEVAKNQEVEVCSEMRHDEGFTGCVKWAKASVRLDNAFNFAVTSMGGNDYGTTLFTKAYSAPACAK
jgi:hypothetical protein